MRTFLSFVFLFLFLISSLWAQADESISSKDCAQSSSDRAQATDSRLSKYQISKAGLACAEDCLKQTPDDIACTYYRAVNRGLMLDSALANPKSNLKPMAVDFETVAQKNPGFDEAGALRALAEMYLRLPPFSLWGDGLKKDLDKSVSWIEKAVALAPNSIDNQRIAGEIYYEREDYKNAVSHFEEALELAKKSPLNLAQKSSQIKDLEKWLQKAQNQLPKP